MGGFDLEGVYGRIPCPWCESTDCMKFGDGDDLRCSNTNKRVSGEALEKQAIKHDMTRYRLVLGPGEWSFRVFTHIGTGVHGFKAVAKTVELVTESHGIRGLAPTLKAARAFANENLNNPTAYYRD